MSEREQALSIEELVKRYKQVRKERRKHAIKQFMKMKRGVLGVGILIVLVFLSLTSPIIAPEPNRRVHAPYSKPYWMRVFDPNAFDDFTPVDLRFSSEADMVLFDARGVVKGSFRYLGTYFDSEDGSFDKGCAAIVVEDDISQEFSDRQFARLYFIFYIKWDKKAPPFKLYFDFSHKCIMEIPHFIDDTADIGSADSKSWLLEFKSKNVIFDNIIAVERTGESTTLRIDVFDLQLNKTIVSVSMDESVTKKSIRVTMNTSHRYSLRVVNEGPRPTRIRVTSTPDMGSLYNYRQAMVIMNLYDPLRQTLYSREELLMYFQSRGVSVQPTDIVDDGILAHVRLSTPDTWFSLSARKSADEMPDKMLIKELYMAPFFEEGNVVAVILRVDIGVLNAKLALLREDLKGNVKFIWKIDDVIVVAQDEYYGLMGTDKWGRDIFAMIVDGLKISLLVGFVATLANIAIGVTLGLVSGYVGGRVDEVIMRIVDFMMSIPILPLLMVLAFIFFQMRMDPLIAIIIVLSILGWAGMARTIRSQVLVIKANVYVEAAKASGASSGYIIRKHILPGVWGLVLMYLMVGVVANIIAEASLSFLGVLKPNWNSLGKMIQEASGISIIGGGGGTMCWHWVFFPGFILMLIGFSFYAISDAYDELINPKRRRRF